MSIVSLLVIFVIILLLLYLISLIPLDPPFKLIAYVVVILAAIIWLLRQVGYV